MTRKAMAVFAIFTFTFALASGSSGSARANLVLNGGLDLYTPGTLFNPPFPAGDLQYSPVTNWTSPLLNLSGTTTGNLLYLPGTGDTTGSLYYNTGLGGPVATAFALWGPNNGSNNGLPATSPAGGNYLALDSDPLFNGTLSQTINGLSVGQPYQLDFWWAGAQLSLTTGATTDQLQVSLGNQTQSTAVVANPSQGFTGWMFQTLYFTAQNNSEVLSFLAVGGPSGLPPFVLLDGVNLNAVPEPSTLLTASLAVGLFGIGAARRLRRRNTAAV